MIHIIHDYAMSGLGRHYSLCQLSDGTRGHLDPVARLPQLLAAARRLALQQHELAARLPRLRAEAELLLARVLVLVRLHDGGGDGEAGHVALLEGLQRRRLLGHQGFLVPTQHSL